MIADIYAVADPDYYAPLDLRVLGAPQLRPAARPDGWTSAPSGPWTRWTPAGRPLGRTALRVWASARADRLLPVLDAFAAVCFERGVPFQHVSSRALHGLLQHRNGPTGQAGVFCTAHPADAAAAAGLLRALHAETAGEDGPAVPAARAYRDSRVLYYGRANTAARSQLRADGTRAPAPEDGLYDAPPIAPVPPAGFRPVRVLSRSGAGCAYAARDAGGRPVFVKQVLLHGGLTADGRTASDRLRDEWELLTRAHAAAPGLLPRPLAHAEDHPYGYLVCELVGGAPVVGWTVANSPLSDPLATTGDWARYDRRARNLVSQFERALHRLAAVGCPTARTDFRDVLVDGQDALRLTGPGRGGLGLALDPLSSDQASPAGAAAELALLLLGPLGPVVRRSPAVLPHIHRDLVRRGALPPALWRRAAGLAGPRGKAEPATPEEVDADERAALARLRDRIAAGVLAAAEPGDPARVFPTVPQGHESNTLCVAYGTAGVVHALRRARLDVPEAVTRRLRDEAVARAADLPPGLYTGSAGIAWVLADLGLHDEARLLLDAADRHPLTRASATLAWGAAGVAMAHLALYGRTGDEHHTDRALALLRLPEAPDRLTPLLGPNDMTGLWYGRTGIALALQQAAAATGEQSLRRSGLRLLHAELDRGRVTAGELAFPRSAADRRAMYYLHCGSAGFLSTACRYLAGEPDERLSEALPALIRKAGITYVAHAGLGQGLAGLGLALAETAGLLGHDGARAAAWTSARALFQHAIPHAGTVRFLGDVRLRHSCELWSGASGVLLFLSHLLDPAPDPLFTVDRLARYGRPRRSPGAPQRLPGYLRPAGGTPAAPQTSARRPAARKARNEGVNR